MLIQCSWAGHILLWFITPYAVFPHTWKEKTSQVTARSHLAPQPGRLRTGFHCLHHGLPLDSGTGHWGRALHRCLHMGWLCPVLPRPPMSPRTRGRTPSVGRGRAMRGGASRWGRPSAGSAGQAPPREATGRRAAANRAHPRGLG